MAKRLKYSIGDIFCIELEDNYKGYGRIIKVDKPLIFIELYNIKTMKEIKDIGELHELGTLLAIWSVDNGIKNGEWKMIGNIPVKSDYRMPNFWTKSPATGNILLYKATDTFDTLKDAEVITQEQIENAQPYGIFGDIAVKLAYIRELNKHSNS